MPSPMSASLKACTCFVCRAVPCSAAASVASASGPGHPLQGPAAAGVAAGAAGAAGVPAGAAAGAAEEPPPPVSTSMSTEPTFTVSCTSDSRLNTLSLCFCSFHLLYAESPRLVVDLGDLPCVGAGEFHGRLTPTVGAQNADTCGLCESLGQSARFLLLGSWVSWYHTERLLSLIAGCMLQEALSLSTLQTLSISLT